MSRVFTSLALVVVYVHVLYVAMVTTDTQDVRHDTTRFCDVAEPWYCRSSVQQHNNGYTDLLQFGYKNRDGYTDVGGTISPTDAINIDSKQRCETDGGVTNNGPKLNIRRASRLDQHRCYDILLHGTSCTTEQLCLDTSNAFWYGGSELHGQRWPINPVKMADQPYVSNDFVSFTTAYGNVLERMWITSRGTVIVVDEHAPLHLAMTGNEMCFRATYSDILINIQDIKPVLNITLCDTDNVREAFGLLSEKFMDRVDGIPDNRMFKSPIWSTWAKYKTDINEDVIMAYADEIVSHGFSNSQLEIDDMYSSTYGDFDFDLAKFEDASRMISNLKSKGFRVTMWITPFANLDSKAYAIGSVHSYWLNDQDGNPAPVNWWQGIGGVLDVTNKDAVDWFVERLNRMKNTYGVDSFKFDAGEASYLPVPCKPKIRWSDPSTYATKYVEAVSQLGPMIEVRCGYRSQRHPVFVRMADKESRWGYDNGLKTLIPTVLTLGILGYPYILPDMIGGNGYSYDTMEDNPFTATKLPERELFIRWLEVTSYFPAMQFSFVPWQYDEEVVHIAKRYVRIHEDVVTPLVLKAAEDSVAKGVPIIRPLWWLDPGDINALESDSQFLVGDRLLVAPILEKGATERDIYIPQGRWEDRLRGGSITGGQWLHRYKMGLDEVATFWLIENK